MTPDKPPPGTIPTLTEVVSWPEAPASVPPGVAPFASAPDGPQTAEPPEATKRQASTDEPRAADEAVAAAEAASAPAAAPAAAPASAPAASASAPAVTGAERLGGAELERRIMAELQKQIELMLDVRLREALAPILARAGDAIVRDARRELTTALHDVVAQAVARELGRVDEP